MVMKLKSPYFNAATSKYTIQRLIFALCICIFGFVFCSYMVVLADERRPPRDLYPPLPDIFLDNIKRVEWATPASEVTIIIMTMLFLVMVLIRIDRLIILKRCCLILGMLYTFRGITTYCTSLTVVGDHLQCYPRTINFTSISSRLHRLMAAISSQGLQINGAQACGDYIFSGHICILVVLTHFITYYLPRRLWYVILGLWSLTIFAMICILAAHFHYTVDVVLATVIASYLFTYYHALCNCSNMFDPQVKSRLIVYLPIFYMFENKDTCSIINWGRNEANPILQTTECTVANADQDFIMMTDCRDCFVRLSQIQFIMPRCVRSLYGRLRPSSNNRNSARNSNDRSEDAVGISVPYSIRHNDEKICENTNQIDIHIV